MDSRKFSSRLSAASMAMYWSVRVARLNLEPR